MADWRLQSDPVRLFRYTAGAMTWRITGVAGGPGLVTWTVVPLAEGFGMASKVTVDLPPSAPPIELVWAFGGTATSTSF